MDYFACYKDTPAFGALIDGDASVMEFIRMEYLTKRKNAWREVDKNGKRKDLDKLKEFIAEKKPHVIAVTSESRLVVCQVMLFKKRLFEKYDSLHACCLPSS